MLFALEGFVRDYRMCNLAKISVMPLIQPLLFEYNSTVSSAVAEYKREKVTILLVAVCSTFSNIKLVLSSFLRKHVNDWLSSDGDIFGRFAMSVGVWAFAI